jgi:DNA-binding transcriptional ArsR family regulator
MTTDAVTDRPTAGADPDVARIAGLFADRSRARVLMALADGRALPASVLAAEAGVSAQAMSAHLAKLLAEKLVVMERSGRHRYYAMAGPQVAAVLEALAAIAPVRPITSLREGTRSRRLRAGRACYDHLAGALGVTLTASLVRRGVLNVTDGQPAGHRRAHDPLSAPLREHPYELGAAAAPILGQLGVDLDRLSTVRRPLLRFCVDWTEQQHHLAGALGAAIAASCLANGWISRRPRTREIRVTPAGASAFRRHLGVDLEPAV